MYYTSKDICNKYGFSISIINRWEREGKLLPEFKLPLNGRRLYNINTVDAFMHNLIAS